MNPKDASKGEAVPGKPETRIEFDNKQFPESVALSEKVEGFAELKKKGNFRLNQVVDIPSHNLTAVASGNTLNLVSRAMLRSAAQSLANGTDLGDRTKLIGEGALTTLEFPEPILRIFAMRWEDGLLVVCKKNLVFRVALGRPPGQEAPVINQLAPIADLSPILKAADIDATKVLLLTQAGQLFLVDASSAESVFECQNFCYDLKNDTLFFVSEGNLMKIDRFKSIWKATSPKLLWKNLSSHPVPVGLLEEKNETVFGILQDESNSESYNLVVFDGKTLRKSADFFMLDCFAPDEARENPAEFELVQDPCFRFLAFTSSISSTFRLGEFRGAGGFGLIEIDESKMPTVSNDEEENPGHVKGLVMVDVWLLDPNELSTKVFHKTLKNEEEEPLSIFVPPRVCLLDNMGRLIFRGLENFRPENEGRNAATKLRETEGKLVARGQKKVPLGVAPAEQKAPPAQPPAQINLPPPVIKTVDKFTNLAGKSPEKEIEKPGLLLSNPFSDVKAPAPTQTFNFGATPGILSAPKDASSGSTLPPFLKPATTLPQNLFGSVKPGPGSPSPALPKEGEAKKDNEATKQATISAVSISNQPKPFPEQASSDLSIHSKNSKALAAGFSNLDLSIHSRPTPQLPAKDKSEFQNVSKDLSLFTHHSQAEDPKVGEGEEEHPQIPSPPASPLASRIRPKLLENPTAADFHALLSHSASSRWTSQRSGLLDCDINLDWFKTTAKKLQRETPKIQNANLELQTELEVVGKMSAICQLNFIDRHHEAVKQGSDHPEVKSIEDELQRLSGNMRAVGECLETLGKLEDTFHKPLSDPSGDRKGRAETSGRPSIGPQGYLINPRGLLQTLEKEMDDKKSPKPTATLLTNPRRPEHECPIRFTRAEAEGLLPPAPSGSEDIGVAIDSDRIKDILARQKQKIEQLLPKIYFHGLEKPPKKEAIDRSLRKAGGRDRFDFRALQKLTMMSSDEESEPQEEEVCFGPTIAELLKKKLGEVGVERFSLANSAPLQKKVFSEPKKIPERSISPKTGSEAVKNNGLPSAKGAVVSSEPESSNFSAVGQPGKPTAAFPFLNSKATTAFNNLSQNSNIFGEKPNPTSHTGIPGSDNKFGSPPTQPSFTAPKQDGGGLFSKPVDFGVGSKQGEQIKGQSIQSFGAVRDSPAFSFQGSNRLQQMQSPGIEVPQDGKMVTEPVVTKDAQAQFPEPKKKKRLRNMNNDSFEAAKDPVWVFKAEDPTYDVAKNVYDRLVTDEVKNGAKGNPALPSQLPKIIHSRPTQGQGAARDQSSSLDPHRSDQKIQIPVSESKKDSQPSKPTPVKPILIKPAEDKQDKPTGVNGPKPPQPEAPARQPAPAEPVPPPQANLFGPPVTQPLTNPAPTAPKPQGLDLGNAAPINPFGGLSSGQQNPQNPPNTNVGAAQNKPIRFFDAPNNSTSAPNAPTFPTPTGTTQPPTKPPSPPKPEPPKPAVAPDLGQTGIFGSKKPEVATIPAQPQPAPTHKPFFSGAPATTAPASSNSFFQPKQAQAAPGLPNPTPAPNPFKAPTPQPASTQPTQSPFGQPAPALGATQQPSSFASTFGQNPFTGNKPAPAPVPAFGSSGFGSKPSNPNPAMPALTTPVFGFSGGQNSNPLQNVGSQGAGFLGQQSQAPPPAFGGALNSMPSLFGATPANQGGQSGSTAPAFMQVRKNKDL